jgi:hypothetical protein
VSTLQPTVCVSSSSRFASNSSSAVNKRLLEANLVLFVAIGHSLRLLVGHVVVRHDVMRDKGRRGSPGTSLAYAYAGIPDGYIESNARGG